MTKPPLPDNSRRAFTARGLGELVPTLTRPTYKKRSPAGAEIFSEWPRIVGPRLAAATQPRRLSGTQLTIACAGPVAMELQHVASSLIERINAHAGVKLVERLRFVQAHLAAPAEPLPPRPRAVPVPVEGIAPGELNDALARLQAAIKSR